MILFVRVLLDVFIYFIDLGLIFLVLSLQLDDLTNEIKGFHRLVLLKSRVIGPIDYSLFDHYLICFISVEMH